MPRLDLELAAALHRLHPMRLRLDRLEQSAGPIASGVDLNDVSKLWRRDLVAFEVVQAKYLLNPADAQWASNVQVRGTRQPVPRCKHQPSPADMSCALATWPCDGSATTSRRPTGS